jgi:hypothetical protein
VILGNENNPDSDRDVWFMTRATVVEIGQCRRWVELGQTCSNSEAIASWDEVIEDVMNVQTPVDYGELYRQIGEEFRTGLLGYFTNIAALRGVPLKTRHVTELQGIPGVRVAKVGHDFRKALGLKTKRRKPRKKGKQKKKRKKTRKACDTVKKEQLERGVESKWSKLAAEEKVHGGFVFV